MENDDNPYLQTDEKNKRIKELFGIEDDNNDSSKKMNKIKINYNETLFFNNPQIDKNEEKEISKLISNVMTNTNMAKEASSIKFNVNINNNYYNNNYNYSLKSPSNKDEESERKSATDSGVSGFFKKVLGFNSNSQSNTPNSKANSNFSTKEDFAPKQLNAQNIQIQTSKGRRASSQTLSTSIENMKRTSTSMQNTNFLFIPCINCNNLIHIDEIGN